MNIYTADHQENAKGHILALDGMRGMAILLVLVHHISYEFQCNHLVTRGLRKVAFGGWTGVDMFFVLSGFLITGILWDTRNAVHYFRNFYARRTLRIFPLYYFTLILMLCVVPALAPLITYVPMRFREVTQGQINLLVTAKFYWPWFFCYLVNALVAWQGFKIFLLHFWSLSVEEHFYLLWPILVRRMKFHTLIFTSAILIGGALALRIAAVLLSTSPDAIYVFTPFRMDGLALGALLALVWRMPEQKSAVIYCARLVLPITGAILLGIFIYKGTDSQHGPFIQSIGYTASILFYGSLLVMVLSTERLSTFFRHRFLRFFGKYSYAIYIFHVFPLYIVAHVFALGNPLHSSIVARVLTHFSGGPTCPLSGPILFLDGFAFIVLVPAISAGIAMITWRLIEAPCLRFKRFFSYEEEGKLVEGSTIVTDLVRN